jgi:hypothetical protein
MVHVVGAHLSAALIYLDSAGLSQAIAETFGWMKWL